MIFLGGEGYDKLFEITSFQYKIMQLALVLTIFLWDVFSVRKQTCYIILLLQARQYLVFKPEHCTVDTDPGTNILWFVWLWSTSQ